MSLSTQDDTSDVLRLLGSASASSRLQISQNGLPSQRYSYPSITEGTMRRLPGLLLFAALASTATAQQAQQPEVTVREGGVSEALQSIFIPPVLNAPFSAVVHTDR